MKRFLTHFSLGTLILLLTTSTALAQATTGGNPATSFNSGQFGRITSQAGDPRIRQFGVKYDF